MPTDAFLASKRDAKKDRHHKMLLDMAIHTAKAKNKSREARHKKERQVTYRKHRYKNFNWRRVGAMEKDHRREEHIRRVKSRRMTEQWLKGQARVNAEEGTPRSGDDLGDEEDDSS